jgi:DNA primase
MGRARDRADRIRTEVPLDRVLEDYGYAVMAGGEREQQFSCDLHGDGSDSKPSARYYPDSESWYCFACSRSRDAISTVMEKEGLEFSGACKAIEQKFGLPALPWKDDGDSPKKRVGEIIPETKQRGVAELVHSAHRMLDGFTQDRTFDKDTAIKIWEAFDRVCYLHQEELIAEDNALKGLERVIQKAMQAAGP